MRSKNAAMLCITEYRIKSFQCFISLDECFIVYMIYYWHHSWYCICLFWGFSPLGG